MESATFDINNPTKFCKVSSTNYWDKAFWNWVLFNLKTLKFWHDYVIIYDVSGDFGILFDMWKKLIMS